MTVPGGAIFRATLGSPGSPEAVSRLLSAHPPGDGGWSPSRASQTYRGSPSEPGHGRHGNNPREHPSRTTLERSVLRYVE